MKNAPKLPSFMYVWAYVGWAEKMKMRMWALNEVRKKRLGFNNRNLYTQTDL